MVAGERAMWIVGTLILFAIAVTAVVLIGQTPRPNPSPPLWDIGSLGGTYTGIVGTIGGFSVASAIFIAGLDVARASPLFATVIGMLLVAFLILVFSALIYASTPNAAPAGDNAASPTHSHLLANMTGCLGLALSWLALVPLLDLLDLPALAEAFTWLLLFVNFAAAGWVALFAYHLTPANATACLVIPGLGFALPAVYRLVLVPRWPALWPATDAALHYTFVGLAVSGLIFTFHLGLLATHGNPRGTQFLRRDGYRIILAYSAAYALAVGLTWFAIAFP
jgi:hypothetical protein